MTKIRTETETETEEVDEIGVAIVVGTVGAGPETEDIADLAGTAEVAQAIEEVTEEAVVMTTDAPTEPMNHQDVTILDGTILDEMRNQKL
jgi:hypothetical protein